LNSLNFLYLIHACEISDKLINNEEEEGEGRHLQYDTAFTAKHPTSLN
jgi:hypothetical protein